MPFRRALRALRAKLPLRSGFVWSVGVLVGGTAIAQAVTILALPLVTRLYTPADFSALAVFVSISSIVSVAACLRLEIAIPLPEHDDDAANLTALALISCTSVAAIFGLLAWIFSTQIIGLIRQPTLEPYLWLLPIGVWVTSAYAALQFWTTRKKGFTSIAKTRVTQALSGTATQIGLGWAGIAPLGLLLGQVVTTGAGLFRLGRGALRKDQQAIRTIRLSEMRRMLRVYHRFPKYSAVEGFANNAAIQAPVIIIAALAAGPEAGYLMLAMRVMAAPIALLGGAVSQVYLSRASGELRNERLAVFTTDIVGGLAKTGVGPLIFIGIVAPTLFPLVFGESWHRAGELVSWMSPWFVVQFLTSPVSMALHVTGRQRMALALQLFGLVFRVGSVAGAGLLAEHYIGEVYAVSGFIFYSMYFGVVITLSGSKPSKLFGAALSALPITLAWICAGLTILLLY